ncbi:MAG: glycerol-3-phosphate dehydrogenase/oxidase [Proteobacteria bacterium]|nr:glycerol-3-phosphate dehydrogenase/oxidase [Pseudomonadota bacterium]MCP4921372.1 glycerol-3-phosphate dehydrogenase/oxidase [Pseudomonadota bacterium]
MRADDLERLGTEHFDVLIIGCGITGAGAARDAARRGLKVACVDMNDVAFGTSSRSSKLIHGGLRYLEQYEFSLVFEAVSERKTLQNIAPHLVNPLGFMFPIYSGSRVGVNTLRAGLWVYDGLSLFRSPKLHETLSPREATKVEPLLQPQNLKGAPLYYDCATDDARLTLETVLDARLNGACVVTYGKVSALERDDSGRICGAFIQDVLEGGTIQVRARTVVNATGPWTDRTRALGAGGPQLLAPTKGVHIVVPGSRLPLRYAVVCNHPVDRRVLFAIPWGTETYIGTTDTYFEGDPADVAADRSDVEYLLGAANAYFPSVQLVDEDVICTWAGLRPLIRQEGASESSVSREHEIHIGPDGLITIAGGKLTTYRRMGGEVVSKAMQLMALTGEVPQHVRDPKTGREPLPGAVGWPEDDDHDGVAVQIIDLSGGRLPPDCARHLGDRYGMRGLDIVRQAMKDQRLLARLVPERPEILALVDWAVKMEIAETVTDVMVRRTQLYFRDMDQGLGAVDAIADRMQELLGWDEQRKINEILAYQAEVARSRRWRSS